MAEELENQQEQFDKLSSAIETLQQTLQTINLSVSNTAQELNTVTTKTQTLFNSTASSLDSFAKKLQSVNSDSAKLSERTTRIYSKFLKDTSSVTKQALQVNFSDEIIKQLEQVKSSLTTDPIKLFDLENLNSAEKVLDNFISKINTLKENLGTELFSLVNTDNIESANSVLQKFDNQIKQVKLNVEESSLNIPVNSNIESTNLILQKFINQIDQIQNKLTKDSFKVFDLGKLELTGLYLEKIVKETSQLQKNLTQDSLQLFDLSNLELTNTFLENFIQKQQLLKNNGSDKSLQLFDLSNLELTDLFLENFIKQQQQLKNSAGSQSIKLFDLDNLELTDLFLENIIKQKQQLKTYANSLNIELFELGNLDSTVRFLKDIKNLVTDIEGVTNKAATNLSGVQIGNLTPPEAPQRERTVQATPSVQPVQERTTQQTQRERTVQATPTVTPQQERTTQATPPVTPPVPSQIPTTSGDLSDRVVNLEGKVENLTRGLEREFDYLERLITGKPAADGTRDGAGESINKLSTDQPIRERSLGRETEEELKDLMDQQDVMIGYTKELKDQTAERTILRKVSRDLVNDYYELASISTEQLALNYKEEDIEKKLLALEERRLRLNVTSKNVRFEDAELQQNFLENVERQNESLTRSNEAYRKQLETLKEIKSNAGVKLFTGLADITNSIPGLRKFTGAFEEAGKAATKAAALKKELQGTDGKGLERLKDEKKKIEENSNKIKSQNKEISKFSEDQFKTGKGLTKEALKKAGLEEITRGKSSIEAGRLLQAAREQNKTELAANAAKSKSINSALKGTNAMSAGFKALGPIISKALGGLGLIMLVVDAVKFIVDLFVTANKQTIGIARDLGVSKSAARGIREEFAEISRTSGETYVTVDNLIRAQKELNTELGRGGVMSESTLKAQLFLTERLKMSAAEAAKITARSEAFGESAEENIKSILNENKARYAAGKSIITQKQLLDGVSKVSGQIAASFGFSNKAIAEGIIKVHRYGLNLQQASQIANGLLDFETSISNELEAELLTGRTLNLERARMKALTGDIAGATEDVMSQMKGLTAEQRKSPIIMKAMAATIGLSVDELQDAYALENDRGRILTNQVEKAKEYEKYLREINDNTTLSNELKEEALQIKREELGLDQASYKQIQATVTAQEQFDEALAKAKDLFAGLVNDGVLDILTEAIKDLAYWISGLPMMKNREYERRLMEMQGKTVITESGEKVTLTEKDIREQIDRTTDNAATTFIKNTPIGLLYRGIFGDKTQENRKEVDLMTSKYGQSSSNITQESFQKMGVTRAEYGKILETAYKSDSSDPLLQKEIDNARTRLKELNQYVEILSDGFVSSISSQDKFKEATEKLNFQMSAVTAGTTDLEAALRRTINSTSKSGVMSQEFANKLIKDYGETAKNIIQDIQTSSSTDPRVKRQVENIQVEDFKITTHPKDSLVMAGGTKFNEETNALLKQLIDAVNKGGNVYMDGNKVGQSLMLSTSNLS